MKIACISKLGCLHLQCTTLRVSMPHLFGGLVQEGHAPHFSISGDHVVNVFSFSKASQIVHGESLWQASWDFHCKHEAFGMMGWRIGQVLARPATCRVEKGDYTWYDTCDLQSVFVCVFARYPRGYLDWTSVFIKKSSLGITALLDDLAVKNHGSSSSSCHFWERVVWISERVQFSYSNIHKIIILFLQTPPTEMPFLCFFVLAISLLLAKAFPPILGPELMKVLK